MDKDLFDPIDHDFFRYKLKKDIEILPRFDFGYQDRDALEFFMDRFEHPLQDLIKISCKGIVFKEGLKTNGLTCHREYDWVGLIPPLVHDSLLAEGYGDGFWMTGRYARPMRKMIDRLFLSCLYDCIEQEIGFKRVRREAHINTLYYAVRANSIIKG